LRPLLPAYSLGVLFIVLSSLLFLLDPLLLKWMIDYVLPKKDFRLLLFAATGFFGLYIFRLGFFTLAELVNFRTVQNLVYRIRLSIMEQMNRLSADYHETTPVGERLYRLEQDVDQVAEVGSSLLPYVLQTAFNSIFVMGTMFTLDFKLTSLVLPLMPLFFVFRKKFEKPLRHASDSAQEKAAKENPQLALWKSIKDQLIAANGEAYFNDQMKDHAVPKLKGKLVSMKPAIRPKELVLAIETPNTPEVTLKFENALPGKAEPGTEIEFEGVPGAFTKEPFMLTFDVEGKDKIAGWPAQAAPSVRKTASRTKKN